MKITVLNKACLKLYFLGSGSIGIPSLNALIGTPDIELVGIGTQPDRPAGRHKTLTPTDVGRWASEQNLKVDKPPSVNSETFLEYLGNLKPDILLVISFGQILKEKLLELPSVSCVNAHASLLPFYRGASPIAAALLNGDSKTGVSFMKMERGLDTGPVYCSYEYHIKENERASELEDALASLAGKHAPDVLLKIASGALSPIKQDDGKASYAGKISRKDACFTWSEKAVEINSRSRAFYPWPGAVFPAVLKHGLETEIKISRARVCKEMESRPGEILKADKHGWIVACGEDALELLSVIPKGKKEMSGAEFIRGAHFTTGDILPSGKVNTEINNLKTNKHIGIYR